MNKTFSLRGVRYEVPAVVVTLEEVYGESAALIEVPGGYEFTGEFRPPKRAEKIASTSSIFKCETYLTVLRNVGEQILETVTGPRLILRKVTKNRLVFTPLYTSKSVLPGRWYMSANGERLKQATCQIDLDDEKQIYTMHEEEI